MPSMYEFQFKTKTADLRQKHYYRKRSKIGFFHRENFTPRLAQIAFVRLDVHCVQAIDVKLVALEKFALLFAFTTQ